MAAVDPRKLRPADLARLLNSTPLGEVVSEDQLRKHRTRAGFRLGRGAPVDLYRYAAWLADLRHGPKVDTKAADYEARKEAARARNAAMSLSGRDIGAIPEVVDPGRKAAAKSDLQLFCHTYLHQTFTLAWSPDHLKVIARIEQAVLRGGLSAFAMPRGSGKTSIAEAGGLWAIGYGHRQFLGVGRF